MKQHIPILIAVGHSQDYEELLRTFRLCGQYNPAFHCKNASETLAFLRHPLSQNPRTAPRPGAVFLDLNLPGGHGLSLLGDIKAEPQLQSIPLMLLIDSSNEYDTNAFYATGATSYIQKPIGCEHFRYVVQLCLKYWLEKALASFQTHPYFYSYTASSASTPSPPTSKKHGSPQKPR